MSAQFEFFAAARTHGSSSRDGAVFEKAIKDRAVITDIVCVGQNKDKLVILTLDLLLGELVLVVGVDSVQEVDVLVGVEL